MVSCDENHMIKAPELTGVVSVKYAIIEMNRLNVIYMVRL